MPAAVAAAPAARPEPPKVNLDEELWAAAEASQKRALYVDYLFRFPNGVRATVAQAKAGSYWLRDTSTGCAVLFTGTPSGQQSKVVWQGACAGGKMQGKGSLTVEWPEQRRRMVAEYTYFDGMDSGPCSVELRVEDKLRSRTQGTCQDYLEGDVSNKFEGTWEEFNPDGTPLTTFIGTRLSRWAGEREFRGERTFHKSGNIFNGTEKGEISNGTIKFKAGTAIRCKFIKGQANGSNCEFNYADGGSYKGDLADGRPSGRGLVRYPTGVTYEGDFRDGVPWGQGVRTESDGSKVVGGFVAGKFDGDVVMIAKDGRRTSARFVAGVRDR